MTVLPPSPFLSDTPSGVSVPADSFISPLPQESAGNQSEPAPVGILAGAETQPAGEPQPPAGSFDLDDTDHIHEIFHFARKLVEATPSRFVLDVPAFEAAIAEPMPLFLREPGFLR